MTDPDRASMRALLPEPIRLSSGLQITNSQLRQAVEKTNRSLALLKRKTENLSLNIFTVIEFRMLSGLVGEMFVKALSESAHDLEKNPNIDGYPDLLDVSTSRAKLNFDEWKTSDPSQFVKYRYGGVEVKNTFGEKARGADLAPGEQRVGRITKRPIWKAHHQYTNNLIALVSDFIDRCPQIVLVMYTDELEEEDWTKKQNPKAGSTMTSFTQTKNSAFYKLKAGARLLRNETKYLEFWSN